MITFDPNFKDFALVPIEEPNVKEIKEKVYDLDKRFNESQSGDEAINIVKEYFKLSDDISTNLSLIMARHSIDTKNEEYERLNNIVDESIPEITQACNKFDKDLYNSKFRKELTEAFGEYYFQKVEQSMRTFSDEIVPLLVEENKLVSEYTNLIASGLIEFQGEKYSIPQMGKFTTATDRKVRSEANEKVWKFYSDNDEKISDIYDRMVKVRTKIAKTLGYENFLPLAYDRMGRLDWSSKDAKEYRAKILKYIVPLSNKIFKAQKDRLGFKDDTKYYDYNIFYKSGDPKPKGTPDELVNVAKEMYAELSPIASKYFNFMVDHNCMDLLAKPGKAGGGYMEYFPSLKTSFIFSNFNGSSGDIDVLTHEFGHSLQGFLGGENTIVPEYRMPGLECCEMHSMSMEYLTYPWMDKFFKEDTEKYKYKHLCDALTFIPYGCIVDALQEYVYEHPELTPAERKAYWRGLEKQYLSHREFKENEFLNNGGYWYRQSHIFQNPMYYLDYTIAQVVSLEFFSESLVDHKKAFDKYIAFDKLAGTLPFRALLKKADIKNPMDGDTLKEVSESIMKYLDSFNLENIDK